MVDKKLERISLRNVVFKKQPRQDTSKKSLEGLMSSMDGQGMLQEPIFKLNAEGQLECLAGNRRTQAAILLGWTEIDAWIIRGEMEPGDDVVIRATENIQRKDLNPMEVAMEIHAISEAKGLTGEQVAMVLGKTPGYVTKHATLVKLPEWIQELVRSRKVGMEAGYQLSRCDSDEEQAKLANDVAENRLSRGDLIRKLRRTNAEASQTTKASRAQLKLPEGNVTVSAGELSLDSLIEILEDTVSRAKKARKQSLTLTTFVKTLRDQAAA